MFDLHTDNYQPQAELDMDFPRITPTMPKPGTDEAKALEMMLKDGGVDSDGFHAATGSHRLPASIYSLHRVRGFAFEIYDAPRPVPGKPNRQINWYRLDLSKFNLPEELLSKVVNNE